jgi:DDE superfamily endonuclease
MTRGKEIPEAIRNQIVGMRRVGTEFPEIGRKELEEVGWIGWGPKTWPSNSPDLNPIENVWHIVKTDIRKMDPQPRTKQQLIEALLKAWKNLYMEKINKLCDSMPRRMRLVVQAEGGAIGF